MALNLKTLSTRAITALVFVVVLLSCILFNFISFALLFCIVSMWGLCEFYQLAGKLGARPYRAIGMITGALIFIYTVLYNIHGVQFPLGVPLILIVSFSIFISGLFDKTQGVITNIAYTFAGIIYAVIPFALLVNVSCLHFSSQCVLYNQGGSTLALSNDLAPYNYHYVLGIILLIWASDTGAYLVGSLIGKNKLFERVSPGKTWEGSIGATVINIGCAYIISTWFTELALVHWIAISVLVSVFGTLGDLIESMMKRHAGVKDSGKIMPGHGGILDRFDSLIFVTPFIYAYLIFIS